MFHFTYPPTAMSVLFHKSPDLIEYCGKTDQISILQRSYDVISLHSPEPSPFHTQLGNGPIVQRCESRGGLQTWCILSVIVTDESAGDDDHVDKS